MLRVRSEISGAFRAFKGRAKLAQAAENRSWEMKGDVQFLSLCLFEFVLSCVELHVSVWRFVVLFF